MNTRTQTRANVSLPARIPSLIRNIATLKSPFLALLLSMLGFFSVSTVHAAGVVGTGIPSSCTEIALDTALTGGGTVTFNCGGAATITVTSAKTISSNTTIDGGGLITISGGNTVSVFYVNSGISLNLQNLTVANGKAGIAGGGIYDLGTVNISNCTFSNNWAGAGGAAIYSNNYYGEGILNITNSTFSGNYSGMSGSAISGRGTLNITDSSFFNNTSGLGGGSIASGGTTTILNSTFSGNTADAGGGISFESSTLVITNSTFYSNTVTSQGGGIYGYSGIITVTNSTFYGNNATTAGGSIFNESASVTLYNTMVANSTLSGNCSGVITNGGSNLDSGATCGFGSANGSLSNRDPLLAPLGNYGGQTQTMGLLLSSPAIDAVIGNANCPATDQRGVARPQGAWCDIGAFEGVVRILFFPLILKK